MKTLFRKIGSDAIENNDIINQAALIISEGGLVAFPTETVYGLGADALNKDASRKIYKAKGRPSDNPLIVHISRLDQVYTIAANINETALRLMKSFWPGPLTIVLKKLPVVPDETTGGLNTVAVRLPDNDIAVSLISACKRPIAAPSANISNKPSPVTAAHVMKDMDGRIDMVIDGGAVAFGLESTIVDARDDNVKLLRPGAVTVEMLQKIVGTVKIATELNSDNAGIIAPGMKYKHYSPDAQMHIVKGSDKHAVASEILRLIKESGKRCAVLATDETMCLYKETDFVYSMGQRENPWEIGRNIFHILRRFDETDIEEIYSEAIDEEGIGLAVMNRLVRATGHRVINI
jgi:L-threonylcarbamoyladenylate synthase